MNKLPKSKTNIQNKQIAVKQSHSDYEPAISHRLSQPHKNVTKSELISAIDPNYKNISTRQLSELAVGSSLLEIHYWEGPHTASYNYNGLLCPSMTEINWQSAVNWWNQKHTCDDWWDGDSVTKCSSSNRFVSWKWYCDCIVQKKNSPFTFRTFFNVMFFFIISLRWIMSCNIWNVS